MPVGRPSHIHHRKSKPFIEVPVARIVAERLGVTGVGAVHHVDTTTEVEPFAPISRFLDVDPRLMVVEAIRVLC